MPPWPVTGIALLLLMLSSAIDLWAVKFANKLIRTDILSSIMIIIVLLL
jgi:hypothetical protein